MTGKKAKVLRKQAGFEPSKRREYVTSVKGVVTLKPDSPRAVYQKSKGK